MKIKQKNKHMQQSMNPPVPTEPQPTVEQTQGEHWFVQMVGGVALANTMVSALAMFWVFMEYGLPTS